MATDPIALFQSWLQEAVDAGIKEPSAMTVATVFAAAHLRHFDADSGKLRADVIAKN
jgi:pyridoxine/pyridoxamine 5'-phosphate oxidase